MDRGGKCRREIASGSVSLERAARMRRWSFQNPSSPVNQPNQSDAVVLSPPRLLPGRGARVGQASPGVYHSCRDSDFSPSAPESPPAALLTELLGDIIRPIEIAERKTVRPTRSDLQFYKQTGQPKIDKPSVKDRSRSSQPPYLGIICAIVGGTSYANKVLQLEI